jgi:high-affinity Fe2+/Pb2+ permease
MNDPSNPVFGHDAWRRGALLGLQWLAVFVVVTWLIYLLMGVTGWSGTARALCAMGAGPVLGVIIIIVWWMVRRPVLVPPEKKDKS